MLADGRDERQMLELNMMLAPSDDTAMKEMDRANMREMKRFGLDPKAPKPVPLPHKRRK